MKKSLLTLFILAIVQSFCFAQETFLVKGKVTDKMGEPLIGASVVLKPLNLGAESDINGNYTFNVPSNLAKGQSGELIASYVNYKKNIFKVTINGNNITHNFSLEDDVFQNEEIVVTGIASKTAKSVAEVAVSRITAADLTEKQVYSNFSQLVTGKISGVNLQTASGNVSSGWRFFIRGGGGLNGNEQPVIYIDGTRIDNTEVYGQGVGGQSVSILANLNPNDIENIEVLKGPSAAAMYGTGASNGVVLITTKQGKMGLGAGGRGYSISYQFNYGMNTPSFKYDADKYYNANTINSILDPTGLIQEHQFSITGGTGFLRYYTSFESRLEKGLIPSQNTMDRKNIRLNLTAIPSEEFSLQMNTSYIWNKLDRPNNDNNTWGWMLNAFSYYPAFISTDSLALSAEEDKNKIDQFIGSAKLTWRPFQNFEINGGFGIDYNSFREDQYYPFGYVYGGETYGYRGLFSRDAKRFTYDFNARYSFSLFDKLNITSIVGSQLQDRSTFTLFNNAEDFNSPYITTIDAAASKTYAANTYFYSRDAGIYWENNFSWDNTYFWTLAARRDYASAFGTDAPSADYPKASAAVRLDRFGILPSEIQMLKLRASYGVTGQLPGILDGIPFTWSAIAGGNGVGLIPNSIGNTAVKPESIKEFELGLDIEFLRMFSLEFTHYRQNATNSIVYSGLAPSYGYYNPDPNITTNVLAYPFNIGKLSNWGYEAQLQFNPIRSTDYDLGFTFIWNYQNSEVEDLGNTTELFDGNQNVEKVGWKKHEFYSQVSAGPILDPTTKKLTGIEPVRDANGAIAKVDKGNPLPDHSGSFSINFRFLKNFNFNAFAEFGFNNSVYSYSIYRAARAGSYLPYNRLATQLGVNTLYKLPVDASVTPLTPGTPEYVEAANKFASMYTGYQGNWIFPADYFALREMSLSYDCTDLLKAYLPNYYLSSLVVGMSVRNVFRTSKYDLDYEVNYQGGSGANAIGTYSSDLGTLPQPRTYNFWVRVGI
jgi:TonB-dependent starch-binding outer membrane protein SusC